jgi:hypothetical protein
VVESRVANPDLDRKRDSPVGIRRRVRRGSSRNQGRYLGQYRQFQRLKAALDGRHWDKSSDEHGWDLEARGIGER